MNACFATHMDSDRYKHGRGIYVDFAMVLRRPLKNVACKAMQQKYHRMGNGKIMKLVHVHAQKCMHACVQHTCVCAQTHIRQPTNHQTVTNKHENHKWTNRKQTQNNKQRIWQNGATCAKQSINQLTNKHTKQTY